MSGGFASAGRSEEGLSVLSLREDEGGQSVRLLPEVGGMLVDYRVQHEGREVPLLDVPPNLSTVKQDPLRWGCPLLFPFPSRIRDGIFSFEGQTYKFTESLLDGHHIHGLVYSRPWRVERCEAGGSGALATLGFDSQRDPEIREQYPFPFELEVTYALGRAGLVVTFWVRNTGSRPLPMGLGLHPYLRVPIDASTPLDRCRVRVPARAHWELKEKLPTGRVLPVSGPLDLTKGPVLEGLELDQAFTQLDAPDGQALRCELEDDAAKLRIVVEADDAFREVVVYTPPGRPSVCIEPYTCTVDAPNLQARGVDAGLRVLEPGQQFRARTRIFAEQLE